MTPAEQRLMNEMIRDAVRDAVVPLKAEIEHLKGVDKTHSGRFKAITEQEIPKLRTSVTNEREEHTQAVGSAFEKLVHVVNDMADAQALILENQRIAEERSKRTLVVVEDGLGGATKQPASVVAVGQNKALAIDAETTAKTVRKMSRAQKVGLSVVGAIPVLLKLLEVLLPHAPK